MAGRIRVGISGWTYRPWRGVFYPKDLRQKDELAYAASRFPTIEINGTFYSLQRPSSFIRWAEQTPADFVFSLKGPRFVTHMKRLVEVEIPLANFFASGPLAVGAKLGPILWQLPPAFRFDAERLSRFFDMLPNDMASAARLARKHDGRLKERAFLSPISGGPVRHALEVRHESFRDGAFIDLLRSRGIAAVVADSVSWPCIADPTTDFMYLRLHGSEELYASGYDGPALDGWAARILAWRQGEAAADLATIVPASRREGPRDVYVYFDNDAKVRAPPDAIGLISRLGDQPFAITEAGS